MLKKIITYFIILAVVLPIFATVVPFGGGIKTVYAAGDGNEISDICDLGITRAMLSKASGGVVSPPAGSVWNCAMYVTAHFLYGVVMQGAIQVAGWASSLFNLSIQFSLTGDVFDAGKNIMIRDGWAMVRDLLNLVFIFILLYAAISTILQYGNMDIKKILPGLIVAALLVNFSLMISKVVIDASHVFSWEFYNQIDATDGGKYPELKNDINVNGDFKKKNLANVFLAGFNPQSLLTGSINTVKSVGDKGTEIITETNNESQWQKITAHALKNDEKFPSTIGRMILIILLETALAIFSAFILFAGAIMFIFRIVLLWMVMIFSPVAFLGMVLPSMGKYSKMWWDYLINQSFFAPAFLFMFMLSTKFVNSKMVDGLLNIEQNGNGILATGVDNGGITSILLHFCIVAILMGGSLYIAKSMGGKSAELGMAWAHKGKDKLLSPGWMLNNRLSNNRLSRYLYGAGADKILKGDGRISGVLKAIPGASIGLRKLGSMKKADEDKARKAAEKYAGTLSSAGLTSLKRDTEDKGFIKRFMYTGPEGAFKSGKEGYEKIIAKKNEEKKEKGLYHESWAELYNKTKINPDEKNVTAKEMEERIKMGELGKMEEEIEIRRKEFDSQNEKKKEERNLEIKKKEREIKALEQQQADLYKEGKHSAVKEDRINELEKEISTLSKLNNEITAVDKTLDRHEKKVEGYRTRELSKSKPAEEKKEDKKK